MKINFPALFQAPVQKYKFFFLYGNDKDVFERATSFVQKKLGFSLSFKTESELSKLSPSQASLFEDRTASPLILVSNVTDKLLTHLDNLEGHFIFTSEKARSTSKLVTHFGGSPHSLAIASYASPITTSEFDSIVGEMNLPLSFKDQLFKAYQNDYKGLLGTLQKISLFGDVPEDHYGIFLKEGAFSHEFTFSLKGFLLKDLKEVTSSLALLNDSDLISFLRTLTRTFLTLLELMAYKHSPKSIVWQKLTSPVFFKDQPLFEAALAKWTTQEAQLFLENLLSLESHIKYKGFTLSQVSQSLLTIMK